MNPEPNQRQLDALEKFLRGELDANHPDLPVEEAALARKLRAVVARQQPAPQFVASLSRQLAQPQATTSQGIGFRYLFSSLAGIAALVLLAFLLRWLILTVAPQPPVPAISFTQTPPPAATATPPAPLPTDAAQNYAPLFSESYRLEAGFPVSPGQANLYEQVAPETATLETAKVLAAKFGLDAGLYLAPETGPNGEQVYLATDGKQRLYIYSSNRYNYFPDWARMQEIKSEADDAQFAISHAEAFLQARNLLDFPYKVEISPERPDTVFFVLTVDDLPVRYASMHEFARLEAGIDSDGQVIYLNADLPAYRLVGNYPLRTVENAWGKVLGVSTDLGLTGDFSTSSSAGGYGRTWLRSYPLGQPLSLSGRLEIIASAESGESFLTLDGYPLVGNLSGLEQLTSDDSLTMQGQFIQAGEVLRFQVESWKKTSLIEFLAGSLERVGDQVFLLTEDGRRLELPDLPAEVFPAAQSDEFHAFGVADGEIFNWISVQVGPLGGGGGGGGGITSFAKLNLSGTPMPTATPNTIEPSPTPLVAEAVTGQRLEGVSGNLDIIYYESTDGQRRMEVHLQMDEPVGDLRTYSLAEGPGLAGIENYNLQPVRVWGAVSGLDAYNLIPLLSVERYEPLYPGLQIQSWLGKETLATVQGKTVLLFASQDGQTFVTSESLKPAFDPANQKPEPIRFFAQGFLMPGKNWGGYPVVDIRFKAFGGDSTTSLEDMQKQFPNNQPKVLPESAAPQPIPSGAKIERIELVYVAKDLRGLPEPTTPVYLQPAWSFVGHYSDGTPFEIYVQALTDAYLLPEPDQ
jgi:hypothetical protein